MRRGPYGKISINPRHTTRPKSPVRRPKNLVVFPGAVIEYGPLGKLIESLSRSVSAKAYYAAAGRRQMAVGRPLALDPHRMVTLQLYPAESAAWKAFAAPRVGNLSEGIRRALWRYQPFHWLFEGTQPLVPTRPYRSSQGLMGVQEPVTSVSLSEKDIQMVRELGGGVFAAGLRELWARLARLSYVPAGTTAGYLTRPAPPQ